MKKIILEYDMYPKPRRNGEANPLLHRIIARGVSTYAENLGYLIAIREELFELEQHADPKRPALPNWDNGFLPGLDIVSLHGLLRRHNPKVYLEVGSGNSTKVARRCIEMHRLRTRIISIDPHPRAEIDALCDRVLRTRLEEIDIELALALEPGDVLFIDGSHHAFMNSDTTVFFLEILPRINPGVLVQIHDICLPYDYPPTWTERCYSEQYLLASALLFGPHRFQIALPNLFITRDPELSGLLQKLWDHPRFKKVEHRHGGSFWFSVNAETTC